MQSIAKRERHSKRVCARERESARLAPAAEVNGKLQFSRHFTLHPLRSAATATPAANKRWGWSAAKRASEQRERERKRRGERERDRARERARQGLKSNCDWRLSSTAVRQVSCVSLPVLPAASPADGVAERRVFDAAHSLPQAATAAAAASETRHSTAHDRSFALSSHYKIYRVLALKQRQPAPPLPLRLPPSTAALHSLEAHFMACPFCLGSCGHFSHHYLRLNLLAFLLLSSPMPASQSPLLLPRAVYVLR